MMAELAPALTLVTKACKSASGDLAVGTASKFLAVGAVVPHAVAGVAAIATQSYANTTFGPRAVAMLRAGAPLPLVDAAFQATDPGIAQRQYGMVAQNGEAVTFTGAACHPWAGGRVGPGFAAQGNLLAGPHVLDALVTAFESATGRLPERIHAALLAADRAGGDRRGRQAAALLVVRAGGGYGGQDDRYLDLRVDDDPDPVARLGDLLQLHRIYLDAPDPADALPIAGAVWARVRALLEAVHGSAPDAWGPEAEAALRSIAGVENVEERMLPGAFVDAVALTYLERVVAARG